MSVILYKREKRYTEAVERARELTAKYPRSYLFKLAEADALVLQAAASRRTDQAAAASMWREAFAIFDSMLTSQTAHVPVQPLDLIHFIYGENLLTAGQAEHAAREFIAAASVSNAEAQTITIAHLRSAQAFDLAGRRREALAEYDIVMKRPNVYHSRQRAAQGLRSEEHTSELQSHLNLVCRLLLEKKNKRPPEPCHSSSARSPRVRTLPPT